MRLIEIESWALTVIDQVEARQPNEDARVELKSEWIDPVKAARHLAGHANAARGDPILWLMGVDQHRGVVGVDHADLATWIQQVCANFDGVAPQVTDVNVPFRGKTVVALLVATDRAPFVVRNPDFGTASGSRIAYEVPWREGTSTRTANRADLIRLLVPRLDLPEVEVLNGELTLSRHDQFRWYLRLGLYLTPQVGSTTVIPFHRCEAKVNFPTIGEEILLGSLRVVPLYRGYFGLSYGQPQPDSITAGHTQTELVLGGPARVDLTAEAWSPDAAQHTAIPVVVAHARLSPTQCSQQLPITVKLQKAPTTDGHNMAEWSS